jgi:heptaprenylglyceryl phosphate synthase
LIVGGGIREVSDAVKICKAGADVIVIGNAAQENPELIRLISKAVHSIPLLQ